MTLVELRELVVEFAAGFDASRITSATAARLLADASMIERVGAALTASLAARAADSGLWREAGAKSAAHHLAEDLGVSLGAAQQALDTGRRLDLLPEVKQAAFAGELSAQQAAAVADAASVDPAAAGRLLDVARRRSVGELRDECRRTKAAADRDAEARRARIHAARKLKAFTTPDGVGHLHVEDNPERVAEIMTALAPVRDALFRAARAAGRHERSQALDADALHTALTTTPVAPGRGRSSAKVLVRVDFDALLRGYPIAGEVCEVAGHGPVAVSAVDDMLAAGAFLAGIVTRGEQVLGVAHLGRKPTAYQQTALEWLYPTCAVAGCNRPARLERDHRVDWASSKITLLDCLDLLCEHHHKLKTRHDWQLAAGPPGKRDFIPPRDRRHPKHRRVQRPPPVLVAG